MNRILNRLAACALAAMAMTAPAQAGKLKVVASFSILGDMVQEVAGDLASVTTIVGPNADAHVYTPNVSDARAVSDADIIFVNGFGFETWSKTLIETSGGKAKVYVATRGIKPIRVDGEIDPHAWNALPNGIIYVRNITQAMAEMDTANSRIYEANAEAYIKKLQSLHDQTIAELSALPKDRRTVVTAHDAFGYLAGAYGLRFLAPVGIDTEAEPSAHELAQLIKQLKEEEVAGLFVENITSPALVEQVARETDLSVGGRLFSDALSAKGGPAASYFSMFKHNLDVIVVALKGNS
ncbi:MAG: metal ABC transporter solute-binding protein, Zn/Mn family [Hyphomicrobiaceae bacterium]